MSKAALAPGDPALVDVPELDRKGAVLSSLIEDLSQRQSVLPRGGPFDLVAQSVLNAGKSAAESELRVKRLTAKARSKNWLPRIGPDVSLSSLGSLVAGLALDQAVFDNGRRRAERDFAAADVEVAAVTLASDLNERVYEGLKLYIEAQRAQELARVTETALTRMAEFERIMRIRVEGGLSDGSEYRVITQKQAEMQATLATERAGGAAALAELNALADAPQDARSGLSSLPGDSGAPDPLSVVLARAEAARTGAELRMARAGLMPGLGASAGVGLEGGLDAGLSLDGEGLGFGRRDSLRALEEGEEVARRRVEEARRDADRQIVAIEGEIGSLLAEQTRGAAVLTEMEANLSLFTEQYKAGRRSLIELVGQFESLTRMKRDQATLKYRIAVARLDIARARGVLVDGASL